MNWMAGIKSKIKTKMGNQKQKEYFEKQRVSKRLKPDQGDEPIKANAQLEEKEKPYQKKKGIKSGISLDVMALEQAAEIQVPEHDDYEDEDEAMDEPQRRYGLREHHVVPRLALIPDRKLAKDKKAKNQEKENVGKDKSLEPKNQGSTKQEKESGIKFINDRIEVTKSSSQAPISPPQSADGWSMLNEKASSKYSAYSGSPVSQKRKFDEANDDPDFSEIVKRESSKWNEFLDAMVPPEPSKSPAHENTDQVTPTYGEDLRPSSPHPRSLRSRVKTPMPINTMLRSALFEEELEPEITPINNRSNLKDDQLEIKLEKKQQTEEEAQQRKLREEAIDAELCQIREGVVNLGSQITDVIKDMQSMKEELERIQRAQSNQSLHQVQDTAMEVENAGIQAQEDAIKPVNEIKTTEDKPAEDKVHVIMKVEESIQTEKDDVKPMEEAIPAIRLGFKMPREFSIVPFFLNRRGFSWLIPYPESN